jgi:hypothetical protein
MTNYQNLTEAVLPTFKRRERPAPFLTFEVDTETHEKISKWHKKHVKNKCPNKPEHKEQYGPKLTYCFTHTGIGVHLLVKCGCGKEKDFSDYENW